MCRYTAGYPALARTLTENIILLYVKIIDTNILICSIKYILSKIDYCLLSSDSYNYDVLEKLRTKNGGNRMTRKFGLIVDSLHMINSDDLHIMKTEDVLQGAVALEDVANAIDHLLDSHQIIIWLSSQPQILSKARKLGNRYNGRVVILDAYDESYGTRISNLLKHNEVMNGTISKFAVENYLGVRV